MSQSLNLRRFFRAGYCLRLRLFCWPALYRPLTRAYGWNFATANAGGSIILFLVGVLSPVVGFLSIGFSPGA
jgi:hypothetical protein